MNASGSLFIFSLAMLFLLVQNAESRPNNVNKKKKSLKSILLFPNRTSWCRAQDINHVIDHEGCESVSVRNKFCIGQCYSYMSPDVMPRNSVLRLSHCERCVASKTTWQKVQLNCKDGTKVDKIVQFILECKCKKCRNNM